MEHSQPPHRTAASPAFWTFAVLSLAWNAFGGFDFIMTQVRDPGYLATFPPAIIDWIDTFPAWVILVWAVGVWASLLGSILLLMRSQRAILAFEASFAGAVVSNAYQFMAGGMPDAAKTPSMLAMTAVIIVAIILQWWYAKRQAQRGILR